MVVHIRVSSSLSFPVVRVVVSPLLMLSVFSFYSILFCFYFVFVLHSSVSFDLIFW